MNKLELAEKLDSSISDFISSDSLFGFKKAFMLADATSKLKSMLTAEYMKPIMELQGNRLGFRTDKDGEGGYNEQVVKNCLIEAVLTGVQPFGNQFNIIANNMYITKEGYGYLLKNLNGLNYNITYDLPRISPNKDSGAIVMKINWSYMDNKGYQELDIPVKVNKFMGTDAVIGKATRKARKWLYDTLTGSETPDGDINDWDGKVKPEIVDPRKMAVDKERQRIIEHINASKTKDQLMQVSAHINEDDEELFNVFTNKLNGLK